MTLLDCEHTQERKDLHEQYQTSWQCKYENLFATTEYHYLHRGTPAIAPH
jgi:hypothetical protein